MAHWEVTQVTGHGGSTFFSAGAGRLFTRKARRVTPPHLQKADLRREGLVLRTRLAAQSPQAAAAVARRVIDFLKPTSSMTIAGYVTIGSELDCAPVLQALVEAGATVVLPVTAGQGIRLLFRTWRPGDELERGPFGTSHPLPGAPVAEPDTLLVPLLAFDGVGQRLGYGAGYYDRTLAALRLARPIRAIGLAYDGQEIATIPADPSDQPLDAIVTDSRTLIFNPALAD